MRTSSVFGGSALRGLAIDGLRMSLSVHNFFDISLACYAADMDVHVFLPIVEKVLVAVDFFYSPDDLRESTGLDYSTVDT